MSESTGYKELTSFLVTSFAVVFLREKRHKPRAHFSLYCRGQNGVGTDLMSAQIHDMPLFNSRDK